MFVKELASFFEADNFAAHVEVGVRTVELKELIAELKLSQFTSNTLSPFFLVLMNSHEPSMTTGGSQYSGSGTQKLSSSAFELRTPLLLAQVAFAELSPSSHSSTNFASL